MKRIRICPRLRRFSRWMFLSGSGSRECFTVMRGTPAETPVQAAKGGWCSDLLFESSGQRGLRTSSPLIPDLPHPEFVKRFTIGREERHFRGGRILRYGAATPNCKDFHDRRGRWASISERAAPGAKPRLGRAEWRASTRRQKARGDFIRILKEGRHHRKG